MKFIHRLKYYLIGFSLGIVLVFFFFKDRGWDWLPGNRVVNFILTNPINIDESLNDLFYQFLIVSRKQYFFFLDILFSYLRHHHSLPLVL